MTRTLWKPIVLSAALALGSCTSAQLAAINTDVANFTAAVNTDIDAAATAGIPAVCAIAKAMYVGYGSAAAAGALSATATADYTTATNVYNALIGTGGLCAPNAPAPTSAAVALAQVVTQVKAIQASLKSAAPAS